MKKIILVLVVLLFTATMLFASGSSDKKDSWTLKLGTVLSEADPTYQGLLSFKNAVETRTNGSIVVELYSGGQLGADEDVLEQAKVGAGVGVITDPGRLSNYLPEFGIFGAPYLADDYAGALKVMETSVYKQFEEDFENYGFKILAFNYFQGTRHLFTKEPVSKPSDLKGQRIRSSGGAVVTKTLEAMGANTTVLPWAESYQALQQKVIDGVEVHHSAALGSSIFEVTDYVSETAHFQLLTGVVVSNKWFQSLPVEYQTILIEECYNAGLDASNNILANEKVYLQQLIDSGLEYIESDNEAFKSATAAVYTDLGYSELKETIDRELGR